MPVGGKTHAGLCGEAALVVDAGRRLAHVHQARQAEEVDGQQLLHCPALVEHVGLEREVRAKPDPARQGLQRALQPVPCAQTAEVVEHPDVAAGPAHAKGLAHQARRVGRHRVHIGQHDVLEGRRRQAVVLGVHPLQRDVGQALAPHQRAGTGQHGVGQVDAQHRGMARVQRQHQAAAHAELHDALPRRRLQPPAQQLPAFLQHPAEEQVVGTGQAVVSRRNGIALGRSRRHRVVCGTGARGGR